MTARDSAPGNRGVVDTYTPADAPPDPGVVDAEKEQLRLDVDRLTVELEQAEAEAKRLTDELDAVKGDLILTTDQLDDAKALIERARAAEEAAHPLVEVQAPPAAQPLGAVKKK